eukprot:8960216-Pyramimonas_sp.AAC.3
MPSFDWCYLRVRGIVSGDHDWIYTPKVKACVKKNATFVSLHRIPNAGHHLFMDAPEAFNAHVLEALSSRVEPAPALQSYSLRPHSNVSRDFESIDSALAKTAAQLSPAGSLTLGSSIENLVNVKTQQEENPHTATV